MHSAKRLLWKNIRFYLERLTFLTFLSWPWGVILMELFVCLSKFKLLSPHALERWKNRSINQVSGLIFIWIK